MYLGGVVAHLFHSYFVFYCTNISQLTYLFPDDQHLKFFHFCLLKKNVAIEHVFQWTCALFCWVRAELLKSEGTIHIPVKGIAKQFPKVLIFEPFSTPISIT